MELFRAAFAKLAAAAVCRHHGNYFAEVFARFQVSELVGHFACTYLV